MTGAVRSSQTEKGETMTYVDGFVAAVPTANREIFKKHAEAAAVVFKEHGAVKVVECWGNDVPDGTTTSFPMAVKRKDDETVVFSWIIWPSREVRDEGMKKAMADPRLQPDKNPMPFDGKRLNLRRLRNDCGGVSARIAEAGTASHIRGAIWKRSQSPGTEGRRL
jgi:uncharacterized protein YbaA (DUF1428 family)